jgi:hypothetical protein
MKGESGDKSMIDLLMGFSDRLSIRWWSGRRRVFVSGRKERGEKRKSKMRGWQGSIGS